MALPRETVETYCAILREELVPATGGLHSIEAAVAAGIVANAPKRKLQVLTAVTEEEHPRIRAYCEETPITVAEFDSPYSFDLLLEGTAGDASASVHICHRHTNVGRLARDGMSETDREIIRIMLGEGTHGSVSDICSSVAICERFTDSPLAFEGDLCYNMVWIKQTISI